MSTVPSNATSSDNGDARRNAVLCAFTETRADEQAGQATPHAAASASDEGLLFYFAIGSMMNPTSMRLRNLIPRQSMPGILRGWKLVFRGAGGMGDIEEDESASFHGVLHQLTPEEFQHLDKIESIYRRQPVQIETYDGRTLDAFAYKMDRSKLDPTIPDALPGERYLDIMIRGAQHYGVKEEYIEWLRSVPVLPRKKCSEYRRLPLPPPGAIISRERFEAGVGGDGRELLMAINGKVLRFAADPASSPLVRHSYEWTRTRYGGQEVACAIAKTLYEPLYPIPTTYEEMGADCRAWAEELLYGFTRAPFPPTGRRVGNYEVIGWLEGSDGLKQAQADGSFDVTTADATNA